MSFVAIVQSDGTEVAKYAEFETLGEAEAHVARVLTITFQDATGTLRLRYPGAFAAERPAQGQPSEWLVDGARGTVAFDPNAAAREAERQRQADERRVDATGDPVLRALIRWIADRDGIPEATLRAELKALL